MKVNLNHIWSRTHLLIVGNECHFKTISKVLQSKCLLVYFCSKKSVKTSEKRLYNWIISFSGLLFKHFLSFHTIFVIFSSTQLTRKSKMKEQIWSYYLINKINVFFRTTFLSFSYLNELNLILNSLLRKNWSNIFFSLQLKCC